MLQQTQVNTVIPYYKKWVKKYPTLKSFKESNFDEFRAVFSATKTMITNKGFPIKFYKVKTVSNQDEIQYYEIPGDESTLIDDVPHQQLITYYAYGLEKVGHDHYVLLGAEKTINHNSQRGLDNILGWVKYESDGNKENVVLWNTNIGLRPNEDQLADRQPIVFTNDRAGYAAYYNYLSTGQDPDLDNTVIVDKNGISNYTDGYNKKCGRVNRWLPMYIDPSNSDEMRAGVVDSMGTIAQDLKQL